MIDIQSRNIAELEAEVERLRKRCEALESAKNSAYAERDQCVALIARMAFAMGLYVRRKFHPESDTEWEGDWRNIVMVCLPTGQATWHFHDSEAHLLEGIPWGGLEDWDGHDTPEKYRRVNAAFAPAKEPQ